MPSPDQMKVQAFGQLLTVDRANRNMTTINSILLSVYRTIIRPGFAEISMVHKHYSASSFFQRSNWSSVLILSKDNKQLFDFLSYNYYDIYYPARQKPNPLFLMDKLPNLMVEISRFTRYGSTIPPKLEPNRFYILWPGSKEAVDIDDFFNRRISEAVNKLRNTVDKYERLYGISDKSQNSVKKWRR